MIFKFFMAAACAAVPVFIWVKNWEFLFYTVVLAFFFAGLWRTDRWFHYKKSSLVMLFAWLVLHVLGGVVPIGEGQVLYHWMVAPLVPAPYDILKFDQVMHAYTYVVIGLLLDDVARVLLKPDLPRVARFITVTLAACGIGALNEVMEFAAVCLFPGTTVGDYTNNALDLVFNTLGALTAATVRLRDKI